MYNCYTFSRFAAVEPVPFAESCNLNFHYSEKFFKVKILLIKALDLMTVVLKYKGSAPHQSKTW